MIILKEIFSLLWISRKMVLAFLAVAVISALLYLKYTPKTFDVVIKVGYTKNFSRAIPDNILLEELQTHKYQNALIEAFTINQKINRSDDIINMLNKVSPIGARKSIAFSFKTHKDDAYLEEFIQFLINSYEAKFKDLNKKNIDLVFHYKNILNKLQEEKYQLLNYQNYDKAKILPTTSLIFLINNEIEIINRKIYEMDNEVESNNIYIENISKKLSAKSNPTTVLSLFLILGLIAGIVYSVLSINKKHI